MRIEIGDFLERIKQKTLLYMSAHFIALGKVNNFFAETHKIKLTNPNRNANIFPATFFRLKTMKNTAVRL